VEYKDKFGWTPWGEEVCVLTGRGVRSPFYPRASGGKAAGIETAPWPWIWRCRLKKGGPGGKG